MCRFFFREIFLHPSLSDVEMFLRLDSESFINTSLNLFKMMKHNIVYMHNKIMPDKKYVVKQLSYFTKSLIKLLNVSVKDLSNYKLTFIKTSLIYYNNFEICRLSFFRSKEMFIFMNLVDLSYGQFIYRWGDAPLRYISLSLFAKNETKIPLPNKVKYCHRHCNY